MKCKKAIVGALCLSLSLSLFLTGCGSKNNSNTNAGDSNASSSSGEDKTYGIIESIDADNNTITIKVMGEKPDGDFDPSQKPEGDFSPEDFTGQERPDMPAEGYTGQERPDMPAEAFTGEKPETMPDGASNFGGGESKTYTVSKKASITDMSGNSISLSGLGQNSFVEITLNGDEITSLSVTENIQMPTKESK